MPFLKCDSDPLQSDFLQFCEQSKSWLDSYAEFMALKELNDDSAWPFWKQNVQRMLRIFWSRSSFSSNFFGNGML